MPDAIDLKLIEVIQHGLPLVSRPYAEVAKDVGISEAEVIERIQNLKQQGIIKRMGVIVKHRQLGYKANAMIVWNIPDEIINTLGKQLSRFSFVTLCYQRPRRGEIWPYNLYCMIHGKNRETVLAQLAQLTENCQLEAFKREILFSRQCYKQQGAIYKQSTQAVVELAEHG